MPNCEFPRCTNAAEFCFDDEPGVPRFCADHKDNTMISIKTCEFPRCTEAPCYCFADEPEVARFCGKHKSDDMVLAPGATAPPKSEEEEIMIVAAEATPIVTATPVEGAPTPAALELAYKYFQLKPEYDSLETIASDASAHQSKLDGLKSQIKTEVASIHKTSKSIEKLEKQLESQDHKWVDCFGKSIFGLGILMKDQKLVDKKAAALKTDEQKKAELEGAKAKDETTLASMQKEQARLDGLVEVRDALDARVQELRATCLELEGTTTLRRLQSKHQNHERMHESLTYCRQDVQKAHKMFQKALNIQAIAARSNAMAAGANLGQAIGGGGGRGIGQSPGERILQIRRNRATKESIMIAKEAAEKLNVAQNRMSNDLRVNYAEEMKGVGIIEVPDLWSGNFFRDFLVGQAAGNIGDAINQGRAMAKIRRNMEELERIIAACAEQERALLVVDTKLGTAVNDLKAKVFTEEKRILDGVIEAAKATTAEAQGSSTTLSVKAEA